MTTNERNDMKEYQLICSSYGEAGHEFHHFPKHSEAGARQSALDRNHKAELDAQKPPRERYMDHNCAPYIPQQRPTADWENLT